MLSIVTIPDPVLTTATRPVTVIDKFIKKLVSDMEEALLAQKDPEGVGLAATQVGKSLSLFIIKNNKNAPTRVFINPELLSKPQKITPTPGQQKRALDRMEGCLSIPHIWAPLVRTQTIKLRFQSLDGQVHEEEYTGFDAVIIQHEVDHLNGILFTTRCLEQHAQLYEERAGELHKIRI